MAQYQLLLHKDFAATVRDLPPTTQRKAIWAQVLLGTRGRTPVVKGTAGRNARWRRTPVQGNHYYMWWIPQSESPLADASIAPGSNHRSSAPDTVNTILVHSVRHHDQTDEPIRTGSLAEYQALPVESLDPRFDEQKSISRQMAEGALSIATIKGLPGSGKTVALLYLLKDLLAMPGNGRILYVTYTPRLKRAAQEFIFSHADPAHGDPLARVHVATLNEVLHELTGVTSYAEPFAEMREFYAFLARQNPVDLGLWRKYPRTLFTEIRAHLLGQDFPNNYDWAQDNRGGGGIDVAAYAEERELDLDEAALANTLAQRVRSMRFFQDQAAARLGLSQLIGGTGPSWLTEMDALVIDEVQDLTLLQIAFLTELVRVRTSRLPDRPLRFAVAGDESQIVQPSGFDWGMTKYLVGEQLDVWPDEFNFEYQRRSPDNLADLIDNTWDFYGHLPKSLRPSARSRRATDGDSATQGHIYLCAPPTARQAAADLAAVRQLFLAEERELPTAEPDASPSTLLWAALLGEVAARPGRALVDLTEELRTQLAGIDTTAVVVGDPADVGAGIDEVIFLPREIKGLERSTILIHGLNQIYETALELCQDRGEGNIPRFEARRLFDEVRVSLSRSTDNLVLLEPADAPVLKALAVETIAGSQVIGWADLIETLQTEEMTELEAIEGYLREVEDLLEREKWEQATARNRRARAMAVRLGDRALQREADIQLVNGKLQQADSLLYRAEWHIAHGFNQEARTLAGPLNDPLLQQRIDEQQHLLSTRVGQQVTTLLTTADAARTRRQFASAHAAAQEAYALIDLVDEETLHRRVIDTLADTCWTWAGHLVDGNDVADVASHVVTLLGQAATVRAAAGESVRAEALQILAQRYERLPRSHDLGEEDVLLLLDLANAFMTSMEPERPQPAQFAFVRRWLFEAYGGLEDRVSLFYGWTSTAARLDRLTGESSAGTHVTHLEQRLTAVLERAGQFGHLWDNSTELARFRALAAGVHGRHEAAADAWEALGEPAHAAEQARLAGDMERAFNLLRQAKLPVGEDLSTTIKFLRLLEQLEHKQYAYSPNEQAMLRTRLAALQATLDPTPAPPEPPAGE